MRFAKFLIMTSKKKNKRIEYFKRKVHRQKQQQWQQMVIS
jgi:hypothetical protein